MAVIDTEKKEVDAKIVYYGPALSGKTSNIHYIYNKLLPEHRGELMTLSTKSHRTLFFDFLPIEVGEVKSFNTRFFLYTVPGQVFYNNVRKEVLKGVDGIVFVADSRTKMAQENIQSLNNLEENLAEMGRSLKDIPHIIQYNKRDLPDIMSIEDMHRQLNRYNAPFFEAVATQGTGVLKSLTTISKMVLKKLREQPELAEKQAKGPREAYGLSDEFIALRKEEAEKLKAQLTKTPPETKAQAMPPRIPTQIPTPPKVPVQAPPPLKTQPAQAPVQAPSATAKPAPATVPLQVPPASQPQASTLSQTAPGGELMVTQWGRPQLLGKNTLRLPLTFQDQKTGKLYTTTLVISLESLIPKP